MLTQKLGHQRGGLGEAELLASLYGCDEPARVPGLRRMETGKRRYSRSQYALQGCTRGPSA